jgi:outer membrane protein TolC
VNLVACLTAVALGAAPAAAPAAASAPPAAPAAPDAAGAPLLTLDAAIDTARRHNHLVANTQRDVARAEARAAALRTHRLPALRLDAFGGRLLQDLDFTIPKGTLGTFPQLGALPPKDSTITAKADWFGAGAATLGQPLTQQYRIGLGLEALRLDREVAGEELRRERQKLVAEVRTTYYQLSATEAGVAALRDLVRAVAEVDVLTARYLAEQLALRSDALEVKARLARERQRLAAAENGLATQREHLNQLMGRDVAAPFRVAEPTELVPRAAGLGLEEARARARETRPEVRTASLRGAQADAARRLANAGWIPDVTLAASYARIVNLKVLPEQIATVGLVLSWEPFDWGRKGYEADERRLQMEQARDGRAEAEERIAVEVGMRWRALRDAAAQLEATRLDAEACAASLDVVRNRYQEDAKMLRDVLQAEARLSGARHDYTDALAAYWSAAAELERAIGNED